MAPVTDCANSTVKPGNQQQNLPMLKSKMTATCSFDSRARINSISLLMSALINLLSLKIVSSM